MMKVGKVVTRIVAKCRSKDSVHDDGDNIDGKKNITKIDTDDATTNSITHGNTIATSINHHDDNKVHGNANVHNRSANSNSRSNSQSNSINDFEHHNTLSW